MDTEARARRQSLRVIISEIIMVVTVVITVIILAFLASGYWLNSDFEVERQGMLQIHSIPTGANITVDGDSPWFQRTNTSKVLSSGEHEVILSKDGYDSWHKVITISEGLLYRVNYPRLFLLERTPSDYYATTETVTTALTSPSHNYLLLGNDDATVYTVLRLNSDAPETTTLDLLNLQPADSNTSSGAELFSEILPTLTWDDGNNLIAAIGKKRYKINWRDNKVAAIIDKQEPEEEPDLPGELFHFYDEKYGAVLNDNTLTIYKKSQKPEVFFTAELSFVPEVLKIGGSGGFVFMQSGTNVAVLDMEIMSIIEWSLDSDDYGWLDGNMLYAIKDGNLIVYDFDGKNRRELSTGVAANLPVTITDNKWLYYFSSHPEQSHSEAESELGSGSELQSDLHTSMSEEASPQTRIIRELIVQ